MLVHPQSSQVRKNIENGGTRKVYIACLDSTSYNEFWVLFVTEVLECTKDLCYHTHSGLKLMTEQLDNFFGSLGALCLPSLPFHAS
jgi:hypothetical protein